MGSWGVEIFENDSALDWISELEEEKNLTVVVAKFLEVYNENDERKDELLDSDLSSEALAAAEIVSALLGRPCKELPTGITKWLEKKKTYDRNLMSVFNDIVKNTKFEDDFCSLWKDKSKDEKWDFILSCLSDYAINSIRIILERSELKELWQESEDYEKWVEAVKNLKNRCEK